MYSIAEIILIPQLYVLSKYQLKTLEETVRRCKESQETNGMIYSCSYEDIELSSSPSGYLQILGDLAACSSRSTISQYK